MNLMELLVFLSIVYLAAGGLIWAFTGTLNLATPLYIAFGAGLFIGFAPVIAKLYDWIRRKKPPEAKDE